MSNRRIYIFSIFFYKISCLGPASQKMYKKIMLFHWQKYLKNRFFRQKSTQINFFLNFLKQILKKDHK